MLCLKQVRVRGPKSENHRARQCLIIKLNLICCSIVIRRLLPVIQNTSGFGEMQHSCSISVEKTKHAHKTPIQYVILFIAFKCHERKTTTTFLQ